MKSITVKQVAAFCGATANIDGEILKISTDSRDIDSNTLFVALVGERFDAHDFVADVLSKGAKAVVCSKNVGNDPRILYVEDTGKALLDIAHGYRKLFDVPFIGLTGSVGKTTSKGMIYAVVKKKFDTLRTAGNLNNEIGVPKTLFCLEEHHEAAVIEMGMNHFEEISRISKAVEPSIACITNVGTAHIENLGSREGILKAKCEILDGMAKGSTLIINGDNDMLATIDRDDYKIVRFGIDGDGLDMTAEGISADAAGSTFTAVYKGERAEVYVPSVGIHNVYNAMCAMCVGMELGYTLEEAASGIRDFEPEGMRQKITEINNITFIEDCYNANLDSMKASLDALATICKGKSYAVLGDMLELGDFAENAHRQVGEKAASTGCEYVITYGELSRFIADEAKKNGCKALCFDDKEKIADFLYENVKEGDAVLFKGSRGMRMEEIFISLYKKLGFDND
ncbi:MAG: UDP-N-acetylmuramoyl-tripeptide--D-alanyl-D-alanine ligase [Clostridia bacterium]|nr:UDP-N-acetylmuramoyl-tripeptide--D-alanyl-D-alanine ligase [Clostridia bacterium]